MKSVHKISLVVKYTDFTVPPGGDSSIELSPTKHLFNRTRLLAGQERSLLSILPDSSTVASSHDEEKMLLNIHFSHVRRRRGAAEQRRRRRLLFPQGGYSIAE